MNIWDYGLKLIKQYKSYILKKINLILFKTKIYKKNYYIFAHNKL